MLQIDGGSFFSLGVTDLKNSVLNEIEEEGSTKIRSLSFPSLACSGQRQDVRLFPVM